jgi:hypothetical protein
VPVEDEIDLVLARVTVDAPALPRLQGDLVQAEGACSERAPKRDKALRGRVVDRGCLNLVGGDAAQSPTGALASPLFASER